MTDRFYDLNGDVRIEGTLDAGGGPYLPVADAAGVTVDTTTYNDTIKGSGKLTTLVFPSEQGVFALALAGDAFPRVEFVSDPTDIFIVFGDGTADPYQSGGPGIGYTSSDGSLTVQLPAGGSLLPGRAATRLNGAPQLSQLSPKYTILAGALPTVQLVTATGAQILTTRDAETLTPCTFNPGAATTATVTVALSADNVTYSTLGVETVPAGVALDGTIHLVKARVPAGWYLKLTVNAQAVLGLTTYY